jgi:hypothetical protein
MGGVDSAGNVTHGLLEQNSTTNDMLGFLHDTKGPDGKPMLGDDAYTSIMGKGLAARQAAVGMYMGQIQTNATNAAAMARTQAEQAAATQRQQMVTNEQRAEFVTKNAPVIVQPAAPAPVAPAPVVPSQNAQQVQAEMAERNRKAGLPVVQIPSLLK